MKHKTLTKLLAWPLIFVFAYTALSKLADMPTFYFNLQQVLHIELLAKLLQWSVPVSELLIVLLLVFPKTRAIGFIASFIILFLFIAYVGLMFLLMTNLPCSCGGVIDSLSWEQHLLLNVCLFLIALFGWLYSSKPLIKHSSLSSFTFK